MQLSEYEDLLSRTAKIYDFDTICLSTEQRIQNRSPEDRFCFLRHDIDFSPENAVKMAEVEFGLGIRSTYTVLLSGSYYNPFERNTRNMIRKLSEMGHSVGLHFDPVAFNVETEAELADAIQIEQRALEDLIQSKVEMFSFHNTTEFSMSCRAKSYGGCENAYSSFYRSSMEYTSDSNGYWRFRSWDDLLKENHSIIQILTHPIWWKPGNNLPPFETIVQNCFDRFVQEVRDYNALFEGVRDRKNLSAFYPAFQTAEQLNDADRLNAYALSSEVLKTLQGGSDAQITERLEHLARNWTD